MSTLGSLWIKGVSDRTGLTGAVPPSSGDLRGDPPYALDEGRAAIGDLVAKSGRGVSTDPQADPAPQPRRGQGADHPSPDQPRQAPTHQTAPTDTATRSPITI